MDAIPFEFGTPGLPLIVVPVEVASREQVHAVVDTGAIAPFALFMSEGLAARLKLSLSAPVVPKNSVALGPNAVTYRTARLSRFRFGPVELRDVEIAVSPVLDLLNGHLTKKADVIVGQHFLKGRVVSIDYRARSIDLTAAIPTTAKPVPMRPGNPFILVDAKLNGRGPFTMEIDTGATVTNLSPASARRSGVAARGSVTAHGAGGTLPAKIGRATIAFGPFRKKAQQVAILDGLERISAAARTPVDGIIGASLFYGTRLTIDYPGSRLWVEPVAP
jgi:predicted aspartyl protease